MPPRLAHKKSRAGCLRCKTRKVKCDEILPKCSACVRHNVPCVYPGSAAASSPANNASKESRAAEHALELRLMHEWMVHVCQSFSIAWEFWRHQAPLIAFEHRYVLDALLALSALHLARKGPEVWDPVAGRMLSLHEAGSRSGGGSSSTPSDPTAPATNTTTAAAAAAAATADTAAARQQAPQAGAPREWREWKAITDIDQQQQTQTQTPSSDDGGGGGGGSGTLSPSRRHHYDMLHVSRSYFDRALDGQRKAVAWLSEDSIQAVYMCSILVTNYGLLNLSEESYGPDIPAWDPIKWFRIAEGSRHIAQCWREMVGDGWYRLAGNFYGPPDLSDSDELFHPRHRAPFAHLLADVDGRGGIAPDDREAYEYTLSYVGLLYKGVVDGSDLPRTSCRRIIALPSRVPPRFAVLIEEQHPRALAILAHTLAITKLLEPELPWFKGIADRQVPIIAASVPKSWSHLLDWPLQIVERGADSLSAKR